MRQNSNLPHISDANAKNVHNPAEQIFTGTEGRIPRVRLDVDVVSDVMAARLATCLLGHVLFLKNQVPLPVLQLARIRGGSSSTNAAKKRTELLNSFDTLSSHLSTTFTALSTALARPSLSPGPGRGEVNARKSSAYLTFLVGPSVGSAKSKVVFAVDGLEMRIWGERDDLEGDEESESNTDDENEGESDSDDDKARSECSSEEEDVPESVVEGEDEDEDEEQDEYTEACSPTHIRSRSPKLIPRPALTFAEEQHAFRTAERTLSRALANADSEGLGMSAELAPTQTHILLRAPRCFVHPAWVPRQNMCSTLDGMLHEFLEASGLSLGVDSENKVPRKKRKAGPGVEGVWVGCRSSESGCGGDVGLVSENEGDEMIWWSWDGKIVGFADW